MKLNALFLLGSSTAALAFSPPNNAAAKNACHTGHNNNNNAMFLSADATTTPETPTTKEINDSLRIPLTYNEMIQQTATAISDAYSQLGMTRQIVRILLPRDAMNEKLGEMYEAEADTSSKSQQDMKLVPSDESWQGGIMQLYRAAAPTTQDILRLMSPTANTGVPAKIYENRDVDESGVDGVGLLYTQTVSVSETSSTSNNRGNGGFFGNAVTLPTLAKDDMSVFVQPSQESVDVIEELSKSAGSSLIALLNPQWRNVDDALDVASKENNLFGQFASFLGGKGSSLRRLDELEFRSSFTLEGYVCKGGNIRLIKRFDSDWVVFAENDSGDEYVRVGTSVERPMYQDVDKMLDEAGVGYKYARDLGLAPKL